MFRFTALSSLWFATLLMTLGHAAAQEASPAAELGPPRAAECQVTPRSDAEIAALAGTPAAGDATAATAAPMTLPDGDPVDTATRDEITRTLREVIACAQANDLPRLLALYSDEAVRQVVLAAEPVPIIPGQPNTSDGTLPATPSADADLTPVVQEARLLPDGRIAALVTSVAPGSRVEVVLFVQTAHRWLIDEIHPAVLPSADNPLLPLVLADAATVLSIPESELEVVSIETQEWPDASLGCPQPDGIYAQVITPGYLIIITGAGQQLEYHTDTTETFVLCSQG